MLDLKYVEEHADDVRAMLVARGVEFELDRVLQLAALRRAAIADAEAKRAEHNRARAATPRRPSPRPGYSATKSKS